MEDYEQKMERYRREDRERQQRFDEEWKLLCEKGKEIDKKILKSLSKLAQSIREFREASDPSVAPQVFDERSEQKLELADFSFQSSDIASSTAPQVFDEKSEENLELADFSLQGKTEEIVEQLPKSKQTASIGFLEVQTKKVSPSITKSYPPYSIIDLDPEPLSIVRPYIPTNLKPNPTFRSPITTPSSSYMMCNPLSLDSGDKFIGDQDAQLSTTLVHVVTEPYLLLAAFLTSKLILCFDCEGVDLFRHRTLYVMQLSFPDVVFLVDAIRGGNMPIKPDSEVLCFQLDIKLHNVFDKQIAYSLMEKHLASSHSCSICISYLKEHVVNLLRQDHNFWTDLRKHNSSDNNFWMDLPKDSSSDAKRHADIIIFPSLPWITSTTVNSLSTAAYLVKSHKQTFALVVAWLCKSDQALVYSSSIAFSSPLKHKSSIHSWLKDRKGLKACDEATSILYNSRKIEAKHSSIIATGPVLALRRIVLLRRPCWCLDTRVNKISCYTELIVGNVNADFGQCCDIGACDITLSKGELKILNTSVDAYSAHLPIICIVDSNSYRTNMVIYYTNELPNSSQEGKLWTSKLLPEEILLEADSCSELKAYAATRTGSQHYAHILVKGLGKRFLDGVVIELLNCLTTFSTIGEILEKEAKIRRACDALDIVWFRVGSAFQQYPNPILADVFPLVQFTQTFLELQIFLADQEAPLKHLKGLNYQLQECELTNEFSRVNPELLGTSIKVKQTAKRFPSSSCMSTTNKDTEEIEAVVGALVISIWEAMQELLSLPKHVDCDDEIKGGTGGFRFSYSYGSANTSDGLGKVKSATYIAMDAIVSVQRDLLKYEVQIVLVQILKSTEDKLKNITILKVDSFQVREKKAILVDVYIVLVLHVAAMGSPGKFQCVWQVQFTAFIHSWGQECPEGEGIVTTIKEYYLAVN